MNAVRRFKVIEKKDIKIAFPEQTEIRKFEKPQGNLERNVPNIVLPFCQVFRLISSPPH